MCELHSRDQDATRKFSTPVVRQSERITMAQRKPVPNASDSVYHNQEYCEDSCNDQERPLINEQLYVGFQGLSAFRFDVLISGSGLVFTPVMIRTVKIPVHRQADTPQARTKQRMGMITFSTPSSYG